MNIKLFRWIHGHMVGAFRLTQYQILCHIHYENRVFCATNGYDSKKLVPLSVGLNQEALSQLISLVSVKERHPGFVFYFFIAVMTVFLSHHELAHTKRCRENLICMTKLNHIKTIEYILLTNIFSILSKHEKKKNHTIKSQY